MPIYMFLTPETETHLTAAGAGRSFTTRGMSISSSLVVICDVIKAGGTTGGTTAGSRPGLRGTLPTVRSCLLQPSDTKWQKLALQDWKQQHGQQHEAIKECEVRQSRPSRYRALKKEYRVMFCSKNRLKRQSIRGRLILSTRYVTPWYSTMTVPKSPHCSSHRSRPSRPKRYMIQGQYSGMC